MSEPPARIVKLGSVSGPLHDEERREVKFYLILGLDIFLDVLQFGNRRWFIKLESAGGRLHRLIEKYFLVVPFLRLDLELKPGEGFEGLQAFIGAGKTEIPLQDLTTVPGFLRFDNVSLAYSTGSLSITEKCESFNKYLPSAKASLYDSNLLCFNCHVEKEDPQSFSDHSTLLEHIRGIVSICDSSRKYMFHFLLITDDSAAANVIKSILEMPPVARSSYVYIVQLAAGLTQLPVETISNWLNRKPEEEREVHAMETHQRKRWLGLLCYIPNAQIQEMCDFLKQEFKRAKFPAIPFTLELDPTDGNCPVFGLTNVVEITTGTVVNEKTNEQFSVSTYLDEQTRRNVAEVKRTTRTPKKKESSQPQQ